MSDGTQIKWGRDVDVLMAAFPRPLNSVEKSLVNIRPSKAALQA